MTVLEWVKQIELNWAQINTHFIFHWIVELIHKIIFGG